MFYLRHINSNQTIEIKFITKIIKSKINRLIKEINDLCLAVYRLNGQEVIDWIQCTTEPQSTIHDSVTVNYTQIYYFIRALRSIVIKKQELIKNNKVSAEKTINALNIIDQAKNYGYIINFKAIKRKYQSRLKDQHNKIERHKTAFNTTIKYFYIAIYKQSLQWSGGLTSSDPIQTLIIDNTLSELEVDLMEEYIINTINI